MPSMLLTLAVLLVFGLAGALLVALGPAEAGRAGIGSRVKRISYVAGVTFLSTFLVLVMLTAISWTGLNQVGNSLEETFSDDTSEVEDDEVEDYEEMPETEEEWDEWCETASEEDKEMFCTE